VDRSKSCREAPRHRDKESLARRHLSSGAFRAKPSRRAWKAICRAFLLRASAHAVILTKTNKAGSVKIEVRLDSTK
jgi:hypothetical protein